ncbi:MAG: TIGR01777 family protein [Sphingobacteriales bacterium 41-5]|nr:MAG: TIGR01777 family protein [Sphingobacteriales bacterium 41-5]
MPTVLITGGTGLVGKALTKALLQKGYEVTILTRDKSKAQALAGIAYAEWDVEKQTIDIDAVSNAEYIIHLAGAGVADKRWSKERKQEIIDSRVKSGELICNTLQKKPNKLKVFISASAIGWYGPDPRIPNPNPFKENSPHHNDYLGTASYQWEQSVEPINNLGKRLVILRTGIVLSNDGGAFKEFKKPLKLGVASIMGSGKQIVSWIHIDDLVNLYITAMENDNYSGVYNAVAPSPVNNEHLTTELANQTKGKFYTKLHVPTFALKLALGEMSIEVLKSVTVSAQKVLDNHFHFEFPTIAAAMANLAKRESN